jgi:hypothetical protein
MITFFILVILVYVLIIFVFIIVDALILVGIVVMAEAGHIIVTRFPFLPESILGLTHLVVFLSAEHGFFILSIIVEYLFFLCLFLLLLECFNNFSLFLPPLSIL